MKRLVVLVFDDDLVRHPEFLGRCPARFVYHPHADDALAAVAAVAPDLVLMDYSMGADLSGAEAVAMLRARLEHRDLPICAISSDDRCNEHMVMAGADHAMTKMALPAHLPRLLKSLSPEGSRDA
jgi:CheY-like chemotaxis protein